MSGLNHENRPIVDVSRPRWLRVMLWCVAGGLVAAAGSVLGAGWLPLGEITPWAQLVAFRAQLGVGLLVLAGIMGLLVRAVRSLCLVLAVLAVASTVTMAERVSGVAATVDDPAVRVLSSNVMVDGASVDELVELAVANRVDAIVLPEASRQFAARVTEGARRRGLNLIAVHPAPPIPGQVAQWRADLAEVTRWCATPAIIAGDFNATLDHPPFKRLLDSGCVDTAALSGNALIGTWPSSWPRLLAAPIDHVLLAGQRRTVTSFTVHDITGTDHRALLATVTL